MKTVNQWLDEVLHNPEKMVDWLTKQYHGEATAANRIRAFSDQYAIDPKHKKILDFVARQEEQHANWIAELLERRGIKAEIIQGKDECYWNKTIVGIESFETGAAVAAHAEAMRLERIRAIIAHAETPGDIKQVFERILPDEEFHSSAFARMSNEQALKETAGNHQAGLDALGLVI